MATYTCNCEAPADFMISVVDRDGLPWLDSRRHAVCDEHLAVVLRSFCQEKRIKVTDVSQKAGSKP